MADYLLDTNHASKLMAGHEPITARVREAQSTGATFALSTTVIGELYYGIYLSQRRIQNQLLLDSLRILPFDEPAAEMFGIIQAEQRTTGKPIRPLDAQIAAVARVQNLIVLTQDHHFQFVAGIIVENWLT